MLGSRETAALQTDLTFDLSFHARRGPKAVLFAALIFALFALSALAGLGFPVAWARWESDPTGSSYEPFPHSRELATHLGIRIIQRIDEQATIIAEVSAHTPGRRSARRRVTCIFDGVDWTVPPRGLRMVW